jgi:hypothetical protein
MASYWRNETNEGNLSRCTAYDATVFVEVACAGRASPKTVCALCGMTMADLPSEGGDYFDFIMRVGRPTGRATRFRRTG